MDARDIFIAKIKLPNDPNGKTVARQYIVIKNEESWMLFLTTSSIYLKEHRVYGNVGIVNGINVNAILDKEELFQPCGFRLPTFVDCSKVYKINDIVNLNLDDLYVRRMSFEAWRIVKSKMDEVFEANIHETYNIDIEELVSLNSKLFYRRALASNY